jgi:hypothetical protein
LTGLWNQFLNLTFPIVAVFLLTVYGESAPALATAAFVGVAVLGIVIAGFVLILVSNRLAHDMGNVAARLANWALRKVRRGPFPGTARTSSAFARRRATFSNGAGTCSRSPRSPAT